MGATALLTILTSGCAPQPEVGGAMPSPVASGPVGPDDYIVTAPGPGRFPLAESGQPVPLYVDGSEDRGVVRAVRSLRDDMERVTGTAPALGLSELPSGPAVVVGTVGAGGVVDRLIREGRLEAAWLEGRWEAYALEVVDAPAPGLDRALVIAGSDRRGTIYGVYDLSARIGVSPWYWWADVPPKRTPDLYVLPGRHGDPGPAVRYRGIFINDEAPALSGWARRFGGFNHDFYEHVYELILRLKGNFLWPAMWGRSLFDDDSLSASLADEYGVVLGTSKWSHMMDQTHIGYTYWQEPPENRMPEVETTELPAEPSMGVAIEGSEGWWPASSTDPAELPVMDRYRRGTGRIEVFNRGRTPFEYGVRSGASWLRVEPLSGVVEVQDTVRVSVDWSAAPLGAHRVPVTVRGPGGTEVVVHARMRNPASPDPAEVNGFVESDGYVSMEAEHYTRAVDSRDARWTRIPGLGRTLSAMTPVPVTAPAVTPGGDSPRLEYRIHLLQGGEVTVRGYASPTLDYDDTGMLRYGVSIDDGPVEVVNLLEDASDATWARAVRDNIRIGTSRHVIDRPGAHVLKLWMVDPGVVLQKLVVETGNVSPSYLGPPESFRGPDR